MITVIGDLVVDILISSEDTNYATDTEATISTLPGGQANNVAAWLGNSGYPTTLIGRIGHDPYAVFLLDELRQLGVKPSIEKDSECTTGKIVILIDAYTGERTMFTDRGANKHLSIKQIERAENVIANSSCLYISGYSLFEQTTYEAVLRAREIAQECNVPIAFDPSSTYFLEKHHKRVLEFLNGVDFFFPNLEEGRLLTNKNTPQEIMEQLCDLVKYPVLKMGEDGCLIHQDGHICHIPAKKLNVIDTTGAGDSFIGAFLATYFKQSNIQTAATYATQIAAKTVQQIGARPLSGK